MIIKNRTELATSELRRHALDILETGVTRVLPPVVMKQAVTYDPAHRLLTVNDCQIPVKGRIFVIGAGKAGGLMTETLENIIPAGDICAGVVVSKTGDSRTNKVRLVEAGHPVPDVRGLAAAEEMVALKARFSISGNDLVICLISGGGSALLPCPVDGVSLKDKQQVTGLLLRCGADIGEINTVRKHLSRTKGGGLGSLFHPATVVSLIISDVVGNKLDVIASGPTCPDTSTFSQAYKVLEKYGLLARSPSAVVDFLSRGCRGEVPETPKSLSNCINFIIADVSMALAAMAEKGREIGFNPLIVTAGQTGDTATMARLRAKEILGGRYANHNLILIGGETTPALPEAPGQGGRDQHYAAVSMLAMEEYHGEWAVASLGTDGSDFSPDVAGAIVDRRTSLEASARGLDAAAYLKHYDSNSLLRAIGSSLIVTGNTGTNVGDVTVYVLR